MVQKIASLIDETLMAMNAHLHVQMTNEEKAYLDAHFELIHIKKGEHLMNRGDEVCYLYYLEAGTIRLSFPDKEKREISARFIEPKEFVNFSLSHEEQLSHYNVKALEHCKVWRLPKQDLQQLYDLSINFNKLPGFIWRNPSTIKSSEKKTSTSWMPKNVIRNSWQMKGGCSGQSH